MRILNSEPLPAQMDSRYMLSFAKDESEPHKYNLYLLNNSDENIVNLKVKRSHSRYDDYIGGFSSSFISEKSIENIKPQQKILIDRVNEYERNVEDFEFKFIIPFEEETVTFTESINRKDLISNLLGRPEIVSNVCYENRIPNVTVTPLKYGGCKILNKAIIFATDAHLHQLRKGTDIPYIIHPLETAQILAENGCSEEIQAAGVLHDVLEDTDAEVENIREMFGEEILEVVQGASEPDKNLSWKERKLHTLEYLLNQTNKAIVLVSCADKLSNMRSIYRDYTELGDKLWDRFNAGFEEQKWYYQNLLHSLKDVYKFRMYDELHGLVREVFGKFTPSFEIEYDMKTINRKLSMSEILHASWGCKSAVTSGLGKIIDEFNLSNFPQADNDIKNKMLEIVEYKNKASDEDYKNMKDEFWVDVVRIFYILRPFLSSYHYLIQKYVRQGLTQWYMSFDPYY